MIINITETLTVSILLFLLWKVEIGMFVKLIGNEENSLISGYGVKKMEKIAQFKWISITNKKISATFFIIPFFISLFLF